MDIRIHLTVGEIRAQGKFEALCYLFSQDPAGVRDDQHVILSLEQANKIGLRLNFGVMSYNYDGPNYQTINAGLVTPESPKKPKRRNHADSTHR